MKRSPSLAARLLAVAALSITAVLIVAGVAIGLVLHHFIQRTVDERLDTQIVFLASMLHADAADRLSLAGSADGPPFDRPDHGWYWQVRGPVNTLRARALRDDTLDLSGLPLPPPAPPAPLPPPGRGSPPPPSLPPPRPADGPGPGGEALHFRIQTLTVDGVPAEVVAAAPRAAIRDPLADALITLGLCLGALEIVLLLAILLQVRLGLRPLTLMRAAIADIRAGRRERLPADQPTEVRPLAEELNALLAQNAASLERARGHVANLAHGLKTPLATLGIALSRDKAMPHELAPLVEVMERRIRHHLGRARAAALAGPVRARTMISPRLEALGDVLSKVNADRGIALTLDVPALAAVACEQQDFDEIAGNLLENAFKWAHANVAVQARTDVSHLLSLTIDDDGPGLQAADVEFVLRPGQRLDEVAPGFGFGLSITRELVELYGGTLDFACAPLGGLRVVVTMPRTEPG
ncbi:MAG: sensor histidine kinase [Proteobacteria bacterium]|nr:sensor histidine kinase [Pseudomonadota bacterium]